MKIELFPDFKTLPEVPKSFVEGVQLIINFIMSVGVVVYFLRQNRKINSKLKII